MNDYTPKQQCNICKVEKPLDQFSKDSRRPSGRGSECKDCHNERGRSQRRLTYRCIICKERKPADDFATRRICKVCKSQKTCKVCGERLSLTEFDENHGKVCRNCAKIHDHERYEANKEQVLARNAKWREKHAQPGSPYRERQRKIGRERRAERKIAVFNHYGGMVCACCGETNEMFLTIDHINGGGNQHRREIGQADLILWLYTHGMPDGFQILCYNCNIGRYRNGGICPHQQEQKTTK